MRLFNPPSNLGGMRIEDEELEGFVGCGEVFESDEEFCEYMLGKYPFLRRVDLPEYSPDYYDSLTKPKRLYEKVWDYIIRFKTRRTS